uniref:Uncharacterized protein n=1 Tax=Arion vulgaris TaxID=1028688 RepID=A0A0B7A082_9EUPU
MKGRKTRSGASRKGKTLEKVEAAAHDSEEDQTQVRNNNVGNEISIVGGAKSRAQRARSSHMTKSCGKSSKNGKPGSTHLGEENKERGVRGRLRCSK